MDLAPLDPTVGAWTLELPARYRSSDTLAYHGRDPLSLTERVEAATLFKALWVAGREAVVEVAFGSSQVTWRLHGPALDQAALDRAALEAVQARVIRMLGLAGDPAAFERFVAADPAFHALIAPRLGLRIPLTPDVWESVVWAILGQQVNLAFAYSMRRRLTALCGGNLLLGLRPHPTAAAVAALEPADLTPLQISRGKADYLVGVARLVDSGALALEAMPLGEAAPAALALSAVRGIGPWTTHYVLMRGCGFTDCVPLGDAGLTLALQRHLGLDHRPTAKETALLMAPFAPYRSLATFHLWASLKGVPA